MAADEGHVDCVAMLLENDAMCNNGTKYSKHGSIISEKKTLSVVLTNLSGFAC